MSLFESLLNYKIHIGFSIRSTVLLTTWFLYQIRKVVWIINIFKTILFLKIVFRFITFLVNKGFPIWFINLEVTRELFFKNYANYCGEFHCTKFWIRGFLSNFKSIQDSMNRYILKKYIVKSPVKAYFANNWSITRYTWPRCIFLSNIKSNYVIAKEAGLLNLPMIAMVDTNVKNFLFNFPIPSNSQASESVCYIISIISRHILLMKYKKLLTWYTLFKFRIGKIFKNNIETFKEIKEQPFFNILKKKKGSFISLNVFRKFRENMHLLKAAFKSSDTFRAFSFNLQLHNKKAVLRKAFLFSYFFKSAFFKLRLKVSKSYKRSINNFIKYSRMSIWYFRNKTRKYRQRIFRNFMSLHFSYMLYNFKFSKIFYETFRRASLVDASIVLFMKHWMTYQKRAKKARYSKKPLKKFWLAPFFKKFFIKISKWRFFHSKYYFGASSNFKPYMRWYRFYITKFTKLFYNRWFFFLFNRFHNLTV